MIFLRALLAFLPAMILGAAISHMLWPMRSRRAWLVKLGMTAGIGLGVDACLQFLWMLVFAQHSPAYFWLELALAVLLAAAAILRRPTVPDEPPALPQPRRAMVWGLGFLTVAAFLAEILQLTGESLAKPNGNIDAYATWNLRARSLYLSQPQDWRAAFSPDLSWKMHADYPLLWPLTVLRGWQALGELLPQSGQVLTVLFGMASALMLFGALFYLGGLLPATLGSLILLTMPWFLAYNAFQQADGPLAYFYLITITLLVIHERQAHPGLLALAGLSAGLAAWTKNEGLVFVAGVGAVTLLRIWRGSGADKGRRLTYFLGGLVLPLLAVMIFKLVVAAPGDLIGGQSIGQMLIKALDPTRWGTILTAILAALPRLGGWSWLQTGAVLALLLLARRTLTQTSAAPWLILGITLLGYFAVYLITPHDLAWHLKYSLDRLLFHILIPELFLGLIFFTTEPLRTSSKFT